MHPRTVGVATPPSTPKASPRQSATSPSLEKERKKSTSTKPCSVKLSKDRSGIGRNNSNSRKHRHQHPLGASTHIEPEASTTAPQPKKKKSVTFKADADLTAIRYVLGLTEFATEEFHKTWYDGDEYSKIEDDCAYTADFFMENNKPILEKDKYCTRGLECWTIKGEKAKELLVSSAIDLVWNTQTKIWMKKKNVSNGASVAAAERRIAEAYSAVSRPCQENAYKLGLKDERDVAHYLASARSIEKNRQKMIKLKDKGRSPRAHLRKRLSENVRSSGASVARSILQDTRRKSARGRMESGISVSSRRTKRVSMNDLFIQEEKGEDSNSSSGRSKRASMPDIFAEEKKGDEDEVYTSRKPTSSSRSSSAPVAGKKIVFKPQASSPSKTLKKQRSRRQIPLSPCGSLNSQNTSDSMNSRQRRASCHFSVCSDESTKRRMLKQASIGLL